jgi:hypothetical protein
MRNLKLFGATALVSLALCAPAAATAINNPDTCRAMFPNANCLNHGPGNPYTDGGGYITDQSPSFGPPGFVSYGYAVPAYGYEAGH